MNIIIKDSQTDKEFMIKGHDLDFEIFQRSKGKMVDGVLKGKGNWISTRHYPTTLPSAVYYCLLWILANPEDEEEVCIEADKARINLGKIIRDRINKIIAEVADA